MNDYSIDNYAIWDARIKLTMFESACLLLDKDPFKCSDNPPIDVQAMMVTLKEAHYYGQVHFQQSDGNKELQIIRTDLAEYARKIGLKPKSLLLMERKTGSDLHIDYSIWDLRKEFTVDEAACIALELDPDKYYFGAPDEIIAKVNSMRSVLEEARKRREIEETTPTGPNAWMAMPFTPKLSRMGLKTYLEKNGFRPKSLFVEVREAESGDLKPSLQKNIQQDQMASQNVLFRHSEDFRSVTWNGEQFTFTSRQAQVIELLYEAHKKGTPEIGKEYILEKLDSSSSRLRDTFKNSPAWDTLIVKGKKQGTFRLNLQ